TPPRVLTETIDFSKAQLERGSEEPYTFSDTTTEVIPYEKQVPCYLIYTNEATHKFILDNLHRSSMYSGVVKGVGPRYCPSIEDKLVRFKDKERHQLFLEPESLQLPTTYVQGFSTSLPRNVQEKMVHSLPGLENCTIVKYAYAIEYDAIDPLQLKPSLETKLIDGLFCAGQINGTSGYEEAAGQGLIAGINVCQKLRGKSPLILKRDEAYIGVMIDDLVTKGTKEPYRLLTSRAEYRLLLRHDNADQRLVEYGHEVGLIDDGRYQKYQDKMNRLCKLKEDLKDIRLTPKSKENEILVLHGYEPLQEGCSGYEIIRRPHIEIKDFAKMWGWEEEDTLYRQAEIEIKYEGYIEKAKREAKHLQSLERLVLPEDLDYNAIDQLSLEARQKLQQVRPLTVGQASRISGVNPADISVLSIVLEQRKRGGTV
ncbi:MAG: tRNA uridine-5-carboxymethylaminomethyl(34) synthesis enzyme MnmG, partial [Erysipelotrichaceae bacterium]|nr:tRNA uridine-5-carboxymethylaminomethyl(34) synthesis enzyme MnmG [Erysipelotrichaceae bacterium]